MESNILLRYRIQAERIGQDYMAKAWGVGWGGDLQRQRQCERRIAKQALKPLTDVTPEV